MTRSRTELGPRALLERGRMLVLRKELEAAAELAEELAREVSRLDDAGTSRLKYIELFEELGHLIDNSRRPIVRALATLVDEISREAQNEDQIHWCEKIRARISEATTSGPDSQLFAIADDLAAIAAEYEISQFRREPLIEVAKIVGGSERLEDTQGARLLETVGLGLREVERLLLAIRPSHPLRGVAEARTSEFLTRVQQGELNIVPPELLPSRQQLEAWVAEARFDGRDRNTFLAPGVILRIRYDGESQKDAAPTPAEVHVRHYAVRVGGEWIESNETNTPCEIDLDLGADSRCYAALNAAEAILAEHDLSKARQTIQNARKRLVQNSVGSEPNTSGAAIVIDAVVSLKQRRPADIDEPKAEVDVVTAVCNKLASEVYPDVEIINESFLHQRAPDIKDFYEVESNTYHSTPRGRLLRVIQDGYARNENTPSGAVKQRVLVRARIEVSRGPMSEERLRIQELLDQLVDVASNDFATAKESWLARYDANQEPIHAATTIYWEVIQTIESVRIPWNRLLPLRDRAVDYLQALGKVEIIRPERHTYPIEDLDRLAKASESVEFASRYLDSESEVERPETHPMGSALGTKVTGIRRNGKVVRKTVVELSLGPRPKLIAAIDKLELDHKKELLLFQPDLVRLRNLFLEYSTSVTSTESNDFAQQILALTRSVVDQIEEIEMLRNGEGHLCFLDYLKANGLRPFPNAQDSSAPKLDAPGSDQYYEVLHELSAEVPVGKLIKVLRTGYWSRYKDNKLSRKAMVVVSSGEEDALSVVLTDLTTDVTLRGCLKEPTVELLKKLGRINQRRIQDTRSGSVYSEALIEERGILLDVLDRLEEGCRTMEAPTAARLAQKTNDLLDALAKPLKMEFFPNPETMLDSTTFDADAFERVDSRYTEAEAPGVVIRVIRRAVRLNQRMSRKSIVEISRGSKPRFIVFLEEIEASLRRFAGTLSIPETLLEKPRSLMTKYEALWLHGLPSNKTASNDFALKALSLCHEVEGLLEVAPRDVARAISEMRKEFIRQDLQQKFPGFEQVSPSEGSNVLADYQEGFKTSFDVDWKADDAPKGEVLKLVHPCYRVRHEGQERLLLRGKVVASRGPEPPEMVDLRSWGDRLAAYPGQSTLAKSVHDVLAQMEDDEEHRFPLESFATIVSELDDLAPSILGTEGRIDLPSQGPLGELLVRSHWTRIPDHDVATQADLENTSRYDEVRGIFDDQHPSGTILSVMRSGWSNPSQAPQIMARVTVSRGPGAALVRLLSDPTFDPGVTPPSLAALVARIHNPMEWFESAGAALELCLEIWLESSGETEAETRIRKRVGIAVGEEGVQIFPIQGDDLTNYPEGAFEVLEHRFSSEFSHGQVLQVLEPGARTEDRILRTARVVISLGRETNEARMFGSLKTFGADLRASHPKVARQIIDVSKKFNAAQTTGSMGEVSELLTELLHLGERVLDDEAKLERQLVRSANELVAEVAVCLQNRGCSVVPSTEGGTIDAQDEIFEAALPWMDERIPAGRIIRIKRRGVRTPDGRVVKRAKLTYSAGPPTELFSELESIREHFSDSDIQRKGEKAVSQFDRILSDVARPSNRKETYQHAIETINLLYELRNEQILSPVKFQDLSGPIRKYLAQLQIKEFIREGDNKSVITREQSKITIDNLNKFRPNDDFYVTKILKPGFRKDRQTIQFAILEVGLER